MIRAFWTLTPVRLFALALAVRLSLCVAVVCLDETSALLSRDSPLYFESARQLVANGAFTHGSEPQTALAPGYPLFLAIGVALGQPLGVTIALQLLLSAFTVVLVHRLCRLLFSDDRAALFAGAFAAIEPLGVMYSVKILSESLFGFIFVLGVLFVVMGLSRSALKYVALGALLLGASIYVRPIAKLVPLVIAFPLLVAAASAAPARRRFLRGAMILVLSVPYVAMAPWIARNTMVAGYHGFVSQHDRDLFTFHAAAVTNLVAEAAGDPHRVALGSEAPLYERFPEAKELPRAAQFELMGAEARRILMSHPAEFAREFLQGVVLNLFAPGASELTQLLGILPVQPQSHPDPVARWMDTARHNPAAAAILLGLLVLNLLMWALALFGMIRPRLSRDECVWLVGALLLYFPLVSGGPWGQSRLRMASMPLVAALAGHGLLMSWQWLKQRRPQLEGVLSKE